MKRKPGQKRRYRFGFNQSGPYLVKRQAVQSDGIGMMEWAVAQLWSPRTAPGPERDPDYDADRSAVTSAVDREAE